MFKLIQEQSGTDWKEMYQVFNCGHRLEIYMNPSLANDIIEIAESFGVAAQVIGTVEASETKKLTIKSTYGIFEY
ncbi:MAG: phosphoribosylformylglycinamidine cyclo-ligase [Maribacter sp.]